MSKYGMLGLLEGVGKGVSRFGGAMAANSLAQAEEERRMNLERIRRTWANEDKAADRAYAEKRDEDLFARQERVRLGERLQAEEREQIAYDRDRLDKIGDQKTTFDNNIKVAQFGVDNRELSETDKTLALAKEDLAAGLITPEEFKEIKYGLSKNAGNKPMTEQQRTTHRLNLRKQATIEIRGDGAIGPASPEELKAIEARVLELDRMSQGLLETPSLTIKDPKLIAQFSKEISEASDQDVKDTVDSWRAQGIPEDQIDLILEGAAKIKAEKQAAEDKDINDKAAKAKARQDKTAALPRAGSPVQTRDPREMDKVEIEHDIAKLEAKSNRTQAETYYLQSLKSTLFGRGAIEAGQTAVDHQKAFTQQPPQRLR